MRVAVIFISSIFIISSVRASQEPEDPWKGLRLDAEAQNLMNFNTQFPYSYALAEFEERVDAIEHGIKLIRSKFGHRIHIPEGYRVYKYQPSNTFCLLGIISSKRQLRMIFGDCCNDLLTCTPHRIFDLFKIEVLQDRELVYLGALLLGTDDEKRMLDLIKQDLKKDYTEKK